MPKKNVSFLAPEEKINKLDALASVTGHDRSFYLNEAVDLFLDLAEHHARRIKQGIADIEAGRVSDHSEILQALRQRGNGGQRSRSRR
jgi:predicted transcriptional regulator